jgi:DNA-binding NtrC family response regulator
MGNATTELSSTQHAVVRTFRLTVIEGLDAGKVHASSGARTVVGAHPSATVVLSDRSVSRFHLEIALSEDGAAVVRDLGSRNGTEVDGTRVVEAYLKDGAVLALGQTRLRFSLGDEQIRVPVSEKDRLGLLAGRSVAMRAVFSVLERAATSDATVLLSGETGTGKEATAETLHETSARKDGPLVVVDCGAVPPALLESELFGHEKGAFTGAQTARAGAFERASGGTIFLDEIGELSADLQPKLLRALESRTVKRVGGDDYRPVDVRVIAATNRDLRAEVNAGRFRPDLYYRLAVVELRLPPLRERREDLPLLVEELLTRMGATAHRDAAPLRAPDFVAELARHAWPGNVRELRNYLERCLALGMQPPLLASDEPAQPAATTAPGPAEELRFKEARDAFERGYLERLLARHEDNVSAAARAAGLERLQLYRLLWRHGLR